MVVVRGRVHVRSVVHVLWVSICHSSIEVLVSNIVVIDHRGITNTVCTRSFWLRFCSLGHLFLVSLSFLELDDPFLKRVDRILLFKLVLFNALDYGLKGGQLSVTNIILKFVQKQ